MARRAVNSEATGPATGIDKRVHYAREESAVALCGVQLTEAADTAVRRGGWIGSKSTDCVECIKIRIQETR